MRIVNPATGEIIQEISEDSDESIRKKYALVKEGQPAFKSKKLADRIGYIKAFGDLLTENISDLAETLTRETGKPLAESRNEVNGARKKLQFFVSESEEYLSEHEMNKDGNTLEKITYDPLGVVANISAWNYPYLVGINIFVPALICGNSVLYKPSEYALLTGLKIQEMLYKAGVPENVFQVVVGGGTAGSTLLDLPIDAVGFTGSYATGKKIAEKMAGKFVKLVMELGGKDPLYVTDEITDIKLTAEAVAEGCFYNNGQSCCAVERVYVHEKVYEDFLKEFVNATRKLKVGDPLDEKNTQGAITRQEHIAFLENQVKDAMEKGANLLLGGKRLAGKGSFFEPTVFSEVNHKMKIMREESFGPVRGIMKVKDDAEAVALMNDTEYGLTAAVYSNNHERARRVLDQVNTGTSYINCCDRVSGYLPWSGRKHSGVGSSLSYLGLYSFCNPRAIHERG